MSLQIILTIITSFILCFCHLGSAIAVAKVGNIKMSPIGCGTWAWGNRFLWGYDKSDDDNLKLTFDFVVKNGVNWFDTADSYGTGALSGRSEELLGEFLSTTSPRLKKQISICTKLAPYPWRIGEKSMITAANESICRLGRPIDMLQLHWPPSLGWQEASYLSSFSTLVKNGEAKQIGLSNYGPKGLRRVSKVLSSYGEKVYSNQVQFSLLSRYPLTNGLMNICQELEVQPIGYSALGLGLLADTYSMDRLPTGPRGILFREYLPSLQPLLGELRAIATARRKTVPQVALNWCQCKGALVLVGMRSIHQAKDNLGATGWRLSQAEEETLDRTAAKNPKQLVQNSFQSS